MILNYKIKKKISDQDEYKKNQKNERESVC